MKTSLKHTTAQFARVGKIWSKTHRISETLLEHVFPEVIIQDNKALKRI